MARQPKITAWTFTYSRTDGKPLFRCTVETPTRLGAEHAERCARCELDRRPNLRKDWNGKPGVLGERIGATLSRQRRAESLGAALRELHNRPESCRTRPLSPTRYA